MTAATALSDLDPNSLSNDELSALESICNHRLTRGIAGYLAHLRTDCGDAYAEILNEPEGETVFKLWRLGGTYALSYCSPLYGQHLLAEGPTFPEVLEALPEWPPIGMAAAGGLGD